MCTWRRVRNLYKRCGHAVNLPDEEIKCSSATCKFSPAHPKECAPPMCTATCWQYRLFPRTVFSPSGQTVPAVHHQQKV
ncbi:hypothetical protein F5887DRAFT_938319, partial [Amanita rubescens]